MLKIGNFSRIAGVSIRLLHYYEELGLFEPAHIDPISGYRYYESRQIIQLNKIRALKELGLTLQEIKLYVDEEISRDELKGMLKLKKSQVYQSLQDELLRLRRIEYNLEKLEENEMPATADVIIKPISGQHYLSARNNAVPFREFWQIVEKVTGAIRERNLQIPGTLTILEHSESYPEKYLDLEIGFALSSEKAIATNTITLNDSLALSQRELPAVTQMATLLHIGAAGTGMRSYMALGHWIEMHGFEIAGATREVYHEIASLEGDNNIVEFQLPIQSAEKIFL